MKAIFISVCILASLVGAPLLGAAENACWLSADPQNDVWVIVYDADEEDDRGPVLWKGKIPAGEKIRVKSTDGNIRYQYKMNPDEGYGGDTSVECAQENVILVD